MMARRRSRGQALVEFAIVIPIIVFAMLGLLDLGRAIFAYNTLAQSARQAVRMAMVDQTTSVVKQVAIEYAPTLGLTTGNVDVCFKSSSSTETTCSSSTDDCPAATRVIGCLAIVQVSTTYVPMTPVVSTLWSSIALSSISIQPIEYVCPYDTHTTCP